MIPFTERIDDALKLAARAHRSQLRKGTDIPYVAHPVAVALILAQHGFGEDLLIAGLLHDVVEDTDTPLSAIHAAFGANVARLVEAVSETKSADGAELPWEQRKAEKLAHLRAGDPDVAALKAADSLHNVRSIISDLRAHGPAVWLRFKRGADQSIGYYRDVLAGVKSHLGDHPLPRELAAAIESLDALSR
jgi:(p)ppGpp synthase/HD superfamily hydrolase